MDSRDGMTLAKSAWEVPPQLRDVEETRVDPRGPEYYRALDPPLPSCRSSSNQARKEEDVAADTPESAG